MPFFKKAEIKKRYELGEQLGSGNFAIVKKAKNKTVDDVVPTELVAVKIIDKAKVEDMGDIQARAEPPRGPTQL